MARIRAEDGRRVVNTFRPARIKPLKGDVGPFLAFMEHLFPEQNDRRQMMRWCATLIARPEVRMRYSVLLISETQGVGKTTLGEAILAPLVGRWNASFPSEQTVVDSGFNGWVAHKRLVVIGEIYSGASRKAYDRLKGVVTDTAIQVNRKYLAEYEVENHCSVVACSNSLKALHLDDEDRRWLVPRVTEGLKDEDWWNEFYHWLSHGGLALIAGWADEFLGEPGNVVGTGERAPMTSVKAEIIAESRTEGAKLAHDLAQIAMEAAERGRRIVLVVEDVRRWVAAKRGLDPSRVEAAYTLRKALRAGGLREPVRDPARQDNRVRVAGRGWQYIVANFDIEPGTTWSQLVGFEAEPRDLEAW